MDNLDRYFQTVSSGVHPQFVVGGYIHDEAKGVKAIDQRGGRKGKLKQTRLYLYPEAEARVIHLIIIGDKHSQKSDIKQSSDFVIGLKGA